MTKKRQSWHSLIVTSVLHIFLWSAISFGNPLLGDLFGDLLTVIQSHDKQSRRLKISWKVKTPISNPPVAHFDAPRPSTWTAKWRKWEAQENYQMSLIWLQEYSWLHKYLWNDTPKAYIASVTKHKGASSNNFSRIKLQLVGTCLDSDRKCQFSIKRNVADNRRACVVCD